MATRKTIFIACPWTPPVGGGMLKVADYLIQSQRAEAAVQLRPLDTRGGGGKLGSVVVLLGAMARLLLARLTGRVAGVHVNMGPRLSLVRKSLLLAFARALGLPVVLHLHSQARTLYEPSPALVRAWIRWTFARATRVVVIGQAARDFVTGELKVRPERVDVVVNGVPAPQHPRAPLSASGSRVRLLFLGNLGEAKGVSDLLQALALSQQAAQGRIDAVFVGGGDIAAYQAKAEALGICGFTHFPGWAEQSQTSQWLASADMLVLPSHDEVLPLVILEALAHGVAVVCTPVGEIPHTLQDGRDALFVTPRDPAALAATLDRLVADAELRHTLERRGRELFHERFSLEHFADAVADVHQRAFGVRAR